MWLRNDSVLYYIQVSLEMTVCYATFCRDLPSDWMLLLNLIYIVISKINTVDCEIQGFFLIVWNIDDVKFKHQQFNMYKQLNSSIDECLLKDKDY